MARSTALFTCIPRLVFSVIAAALFQHWTPGFCNLRVIHAERLTHDETPFTMYLNFDESLIDFWLLLVFPWICLERKLSIVAVSAAIALVLTCAVRLSIALHAGFANGSLSSGRVWALDNLLLVAFAEEALFGVTSREASLAS